MTDLDQVEILLVEDNVDDAEMTLRALERSKIANHVFWVKDGAEALDFIFCNNGYVGRNIKNHPLMILLDLNLPKVNGIEILRKVKADARTKAIPVVVMTSSDEERDLLESYQLGVNSYVVKPVNFEKFLDTTIDVGMYWLLTNRVPRRVV